MTSSGGAEGSDATPATRGEATQFYQADALERLEGAVAGLRELFLRRLADDTVKAEAFERLYRQLDETRREREAARQRGLLSELLQLRDRLEQLDSDEPLDGKPIARSIAEELDEILIRRGVSRIVATDDRFDPAIQEAVARRGEGGPMPSLRVLEVVRPGYRCGELVLRPTQVVVEAVPQKAPAHGPAA